MSDKTPPMNFETFTLSFATATLASLGEIENPVSGKKETNIVAAKQHIDILEMLAEKTKGNLSEREHRLLNDVLYELRIKYVQAEKSPPVS